ncbi:MAG: GlsB/YeaQ/YmgE family stress response membrane protein [bacterium]|nr:GlsB/YeaQ/YmgE family stress response membrane protein [bacterium]
MYIIWFLLIGLIAGWLAGILIRGRGYGVLVDIILGIIGAVVGGFLFSLLGIYARGSLGSIIMAVIGAVVFIAIVKAIHRAA